MNATVENFDKKQFEVSLFFSNEFQGRGGWYIECEVYFSKKSKTLKCYTTSSQFIDELNELKSNDPKWVEVQKFYYDHYFQEFEEQILEWCEEITAEKISEENE